MCLKKTNKYLCLSVLSRRAHVLENDIFLFNYHTHSGASTRNFYIALPAGLRAFAIDLLAYPIWTAWPHLTSIHFMIDVIIYLDGCLNPICAQRTRKLYHLLPPRYRATSSSSGLKSVKLMGDVDLFLFFSVLYAI